jgi:hypothetical protein
MAIFEVHRLDVPTKQIRKGVRVINETNGAIKNLWGESKFGHRKGCYVFAVQASKGFKPIYVGRASNSQFRSEVFNARNVKNVNLALLERKKGTLAVFLIVPPITRGKVNKTQIAEVEEFLIAKAARKNKALLNLRNLPQDNWGIKGVINSGKGKVSEAAAQLKMTIGP